MGALLALSHNVTIKSAENKAGTHEIICWALPFYSRAFWCARYWLDESSKTHSLPGPDEKGTQLPGAGEG